MKNKIKSLIVILILVLLVGALVGCGKKEKNMLRYEEPIKNMFEGMATTDPEKYMKAFPDFTDYKVTQENLDEMMQNYINLYGQDIKIEYEIQDKKEFSAEELNTLKDNIKKYYDEDCSVTEGYKVTVKKTIKGNLDQEITVFDMDVYEIDGNWYSITF